MNRLENGLEEETNRMGAVARGSAQARVAIDTGQTKGTISVSRGRDLTGPYVELKAGGASAVLEFAKGRRARPFFRKAMRDAAMTLRAPI